MLRDEVTAIFVNPQSRSQVRSVWVMCAPDKKARAVSTDGAGRIERR